MSQPAELTGTAAADYGELWGSARGTDIMVDAARQDDPTKVRGLSDIILVFRRAIADAVLCRVPGRVWPAPVDSLPCTCRVRSGDTCTRAALECGLLTMAKANNVTVQYKPFEVRILREPASTYCKAFQNGTEYPDRGKAMNSLCL